MGDRPRERPDERLSPDEKVRRRAEYQRCYRSGRRRGGPLATLHYIANDHPHPRLGITASRKVGGAVIRNRLKRRIREVYRRWPGRSRLPAVDMVIHLKPTAREADFEHLRREMLRLLGGIGGPGKSPCGG